MSDQPTATAAPPKAKAAGKKYAGLSRNQWILVGAVFAAALGYILWRRHEAEKAAASSAASTSTSTSTAASTLAALEEELAELQNQGYGGGGSSGGGGYSGGTGAGSTSTAAGTVTTTAPGTPTSSTGTVSGTAPSTPAKAGAISNLQASSVGSTTAKVSWNKATGATSYSYAVMLAANWPKGPAVKSGTTTATSVSLSGLKAKSTYNFGVQGLPGGPGDNIHFTTT
jgi:hypothetical protein